jgi:dihydroxyacetone kinase-like protein
MKAIADEMERRSEQLCQMDAMMGDGDLGLTMKKGFAAAAAEMRASEEADVGKALAKCGMKMSTAVPSTMGTLMASGLLQGGKNLAGCTQIDAAGFVLFLEGFAAGIQKRGKCQRGDRTVLDAIGSAADNASALLRADSAANLMQLAQAARDGAQKGLQDTADMMPKFGKAAVHAAKAAGRVDQGAFAGACMVDAICAYICEN